MIIQHTCLLLTYSLPPPPPLLLSLQAQFKRLITCQIPKQVLSQLVYMLSSPVVIAIDYNMFIVQIYCNMFLDVRQSPVTRQQSYICYSILCLLYPSSSTIIISSSSSSSMIIILIIIIAISTTSIIVICMIWSSINI